MSNPPFKNDSFNKLIYEYLLKFNFEKAASAFKIESELKDIQVNDSPPSLLTWYNIFLETADVRSGKEFLPETLNRIEAIMMKLENEKQRISKLASISKNPQDISTSGFIQNNYGLNNINFHENTPYESSSNYRHSNTQIKVQEFNRIDLRIPSIVFVKYCFLNKIFIFCCVDNKMYFYNLASNMVELSMLCSRRLLKNIKTLEVGNTVYLAYTSDDYSIVFCMYIEGQLHEIKTLDFDIPIRSFSFDFNKLAILDDSSVLRVFNLNGEIINTYKISKAVLGLEYVEKSLFLLEINRVFRYDLESNVEVYTLVRAKHPLFFSKKNNLFVVLNDSLQVFEEHRSAPIYSVKTSFNCIDAVISSIGLIICTGNEIIIGNDVIPLPGCIFVTEFFSNEINSLAVVTSEGRIIFFTINKPFF